jgi:hypothetical protein
MIRAGAPPLFEARRATLHPSAHKTAIAARVVRDAGRVLEYAVSGLYRSSEFQPVDFLPTRKEVRLLGVSLSSLTQVQATGRHQLSLMLQYQRLRGAVVKLRRLENRQRRANVTAAPTAPCQAPAAASPCLAEGTRLELECPGRWLLTCQHHGCVRDVVWLDEEAV